MLARDVTEEWTIRRFRWPRTWILVRVGTQETDPYTCSYVLEEDDRGQTLSPRMQFTQNMTGRVCA